MATYSIKEYRTRKLRQIRKNLHSASDDIVSRAAFYMANRARMNAPKHTGTLRSSVDVRKRKNGQRTVIGGYNKGGLFNVGRWANKEFSITTGSPDNIYFKAGQTFRYGDSALSPSDNPIVWTSKVAWWSAALATTKRRWDADVRGMIKMVLR